MVAQVVNGPCSYVVQILMEDNHGIFRWETVDSSKSQGKARQLYEHLLHNEYRSVAEIYKSTYYKEHFLQ